MFEYEYKEPTYSNTPKAEDEKIVDNHIRRAFLVWLRIYQGETETDLLDKMKSEEFFECFVEDALSRLKELFVEVKEDGNIQER